jgi:hypothetical protein
MSYTLMTGLAWLIAEAALIFLAMQTGLGDSSHTPAIAFFAENMRISPARSAIVMIPLNTDRVAAGSYTLEPCFA